MGHNLRALDLEPLTAQQLPAANLLGGNIERIQGHTAESHVGAAHKVEPTTIFNFAILILQFWSAPPNRYAFPPKRYPILGGTYPILGP